LEGESFKASHTNTQHRLRTVQLPFWSSGFALSTALHVAPISEASQVEDVVEIYYGAFMKHVVERCTQLVEREAESGKDVRTGAEQQFDAMEGDQYDPYEDAICFTISLI
jgi:hypothetical protein